MWPLFYTKGVKWGLSLQKRAVIFSALLCHVCLGQSCVTSIPFSPPPPFSMSPTTLLLLTRKPVVFHCWSSVEPPLPRAAPHRPPVLHRLR